ncbi:hypothetical protein VTK56DRAFT_9340 [Thermocarpiscus australiensis]
MPERITCCKDWIRGVCLLPHLSATAVHQHIVSSTSPVEVMQKQLLGSATTLVHCDLAEGQCSIWHSMLGRMACASDWHCTFCLRIGHAESNRRTAASRGKSPKDRRDTALGDSKLGSGPGLETTSQLKQKPLPASLAPFGCLWMCQCTVPQYAHWEKKGQPLKFHGCFETEQSLRGSPLFGCGFMSQWVATCVPMLIDPYSALLWAMLTEEEYQAGIRRLQT